jgi:hypothetical protein
VYRRANWKQGEDVIIRAALADEGARKKVPPILSGALRFARQPN